MMEVGPNALAEVGLASEGFALLVIVTSQSPTVLSLLLVNVTPGAREAGAAAPRDVRLWRDHRGLDLVTTPRRVTSALEGDRPKVTSVQGMMEAWQHIAPGGLCMIKIN
ncbi:unnamed protein product [Caretta caretta]